jgi:hypothetical protein
MKWIAKLFLVGIFIVVGLGVYAYFNLKAANPPDVKSAPYALQSYYQDNGVEIPTRYYYAEKINVTGNKATLITYWTNNGDRYQKHGDEKIVEAPFDIIRRTP